MLFVFKINYKLGLTEILIIKMRGGLLLLLCFGISLAEVIPCSRIYDFGSDEELKQFLLSADNRLENASVRMSEKMY